MIAYDKLLNAGLPKYSALKPHTLVAVYVKILSSLNSNTPTISA